MKKTILSFFLAVFCSALFSQPVKDVSAFKEHKPGFYQNTILKDVREVEENAVAQKPFFRFKVDYTGKSLPNKFDLYKTYWHNPPISQGNASTCWCYSTTSYFESEVKRLTGKEVRLSEIYTVYWEYIEKAREFVRTRGSSAFDEGSEANAVSRMYKLYGAVPYEMYTGLLNGRKYHSHDKMMGELQAYLKSIKENNAWNEEQVLATVKSILNYHLGVPPTEITVDGKKISPLQYLNDVLKIKPDDYVEILSYMQEPFWKKVLYDVPDNWWKSKDYYNVPLADFMKALNSSIEKGFTVSIGGDVSEAGLDPDVQCAIIPTFDIPSEYIDDHSRQFRFSNKTTTDDHGVHMVGYTDKDGKRWYLMKDSGAGSRNNDPKAKEFGYYFFNEDFVKLKMMNFTVHKDAVPDLLKKFR